MKRQPQKSQAQFLRSLRLRSFPSIMRDTKNNFYRMDMLLYISYQIHLEFWAYRT